MAKVKLGGVIVDTDAAKVQRKEWRNPVQAIRAKCLDCSGGQAIDVRICLCFDCPLWTNRMGVRASTLEKNQPELLDPIAVAQMALKRYAAETRQDSVDLIVEDAAARVEKPVPFGDSASSIGNVASESDRESEAVIRDVAEFSHRLADAASESAEQPKRDFAEGGAK